MNGRFEAVLFDWDDTLCLAEPHRFVHAQNVARRLGRDLSLPEVYRAFVEAGDSGGGEWTQFVARLPVALGIDAGYHTEFTEAFAQRETFKRFQLFDDVLGMIETLSRRELRVGVISNNDLVAHYVQLLDVQHHFEVVVGPDTFGVSKPHPTIFRETLAAMGIAPERALYVGDSYDNDVIGARAAGLTPVLIDRFTIHTALSDAEHRVENLHALIDLLGR